MMESKQQIRQHMKGLLRTKSHEECHQAGIKIAAQALARLKSRSDKVLNVACFISTGHEIDTGPVIEQLLSQGHCVFVPAWTADHAMQMQSVSREEYQELRSTPRDVFFRKYGHHIPMPAFISGYKQPRLDACIIPGLAFDGQGHRIGYGFGHYDRFLRACDMQASMDRIGVCHRDQLLDALPNEPHDTPVDCCLTD